MEKNYSPMELIINDDIYLTIFGLDYWVDAV